MVISEIYTFAKLSKLATYKLVNISTAKKWEKTVINLFIQINFDYTEWKKTNDIIVVLGSFQIMTLWVRDDFHILSLPKWSSRPSSVWGERNRFCGRVLQSFQFGLLFHWMELTLQRRELFLLENLFFYILSSYFWYSTQYNIVNTLAGGRKEKYSM